MSTAQETTNKATFRHLTEAMNTGDRDLMSKAIDAAYAPDALIHTPMPVQATGSQIIKEVFGALYRAFPDLHIAVDDLIEEGDKMVARNTVTGTHRGEYMGVPPTGKLIKYNEMFVLRFVNGRIAEQAGIVDVLSQMKQLGMIPPRPDPRDQEAERAVAALIETYRQGFLHLDPEQIASIWDTQHKPLIYVAQEMKEPTYGWPAIQRYMAALPEHLEKVLAKEVKDVRIDILGDTAMAFFISHSSVKMRTRPGLYEPTFRVSMIFQRTPAGWRAIHFHESSLSAQAAQAMASA
jgi:steroid delta-isomerase-like uncharacterized protein